MLETLTTLYDYNSWATEQLFAALEQLTEEEYNAPGCSGNGSIRETLAHMMQVQWGWMSWFDGSLPPMEAYSLKLPSEELSTIAAARERWKPIEAQSTAFLRSLTQEKANELMSFNQPGAQLNVPLWKLLMHVGNHGTHTRGQIIAAIRRAGKSPGVFEMLRYVMTH